MYITGEEGNMLNQLKQDIGNVTVQNTVNQPLLINSQSESECTFEFGLHPASDIPEYDKLEFLPFQVQVEYTKLDGMKVSNLISYYGDLLVYSCNFPQTTDYKRFG